MIDEFAHSDIGDGTRYGDFDMYSDGRGYGYSYGTGFGTGFGTGDGNYFAYGDGYGSGYGTGGDGYGSEMEAQRDD